MKLGLWIAIVGLLANGASWTQWKAAAEPGPWDEPAAALAEQIAQILGPGQARLSVRNLSTVPADDVAAIRRLMEQDLKARGVIASGTESANTIRLTLSENVRERLWVVEVAEGSETHVAMVRVQPRNPSQAQAGEGIVLRKQTILTTGDTVLGALETANSLVVAEPEEIVVYARAADGWLEQKRFGIGQKKPLTRDPRGAIVAAPASATANSEAFQAFVPGMVCTGSNAEAQAPGDWSVRCKESDDPWPIAAAGSPADAVPLRAFQSATLNYFTGIVTPAIGVDLAPFYSAALLPRPDGAGLLIAGIDGRLQIAESGALKPVAGARDWGSDFAAVHSGCGAGTQIVASGSGEAASDSLRAYELPAQEVVPVSAPLAMDGAVMALWTAPDGKSIFAAVRRPSDRYEVDRVTALCN